MTFKPVNWLVLKLCGVVLSACAVCPTTVRAETVLTIGGTGSALGTMKQLAALYEKSHPGIRIRIMPSLGSTAGIKAVLGGSIDLGLSGRPLMEMERQQGALDVEYARSPLVFATNARVSKNNVTTRELEGFYGTPAASWPDGSRVRLILRPEKDIETLLVRSLSPAMDQAMKSALARPGLIMAITDQESAELIVRTPGALGSSALCEIISENRAVNILTLNNMHASVKSIADRSYPLVRSFYLVTTAKTSPEARKFVEFIRSPAGGTLLTKNGNMVLKGK